MTYRSLKSIVIVFLLIVSVPMISAQTSEDPPAPIFEYDPSACANDTTGEPLSPRCQLMVASYPRPTNVVPGDLDRSTLGLYSFWRVGSRESAVPLYDAPNGNPVNQIAAGYNFVNAINTDVEGWLQIEGGQWVSRSAASYSAPSQFTGVKITDGLEYPFAWVLDLSRIAISRYPGGPRDNASQRFLQRYEMVNIFATAYDDEGWRWYMIGPNEWVRQTFVSKVQRTVRPEGVSGRWVSIDLYEQNLVAYEDDVPVYATLISTGLPGTETNEGIFEVWANLDRDPMNSANGAPNSYALQSVPWVMYFDNSISLHGTYWHDYFGYRQSRGCVNLTISDARWIFEWMAEGNAASETDQPNYVYVHSSGVYGEPPNVS
jgi:hypothetical protein